MGPKVWTVDKANLVIPQLEQLFKRLDHIRQKAEEVKPRIDLIEMLWGPGIYKEDNPDHEEYQFYIKQAKEMKETYEKVTEEFSKLGCALKGVDPCLVDFFGVIEERLVCLCWKRGEQRIDFWHHVDEGFSARHPISLEQAR